jgi:plastocyanin
MRPLKPFKSCAVLAAFILHACMLAEAADVTAQARVKFTGAGGNAERHSNEGVVLWLTPIDAVLPTRTPAGPRTRLQLAQKNKEFVPHLLAVQTGSVVEFPNLDPFFHNVFSQFNGKRFDLGLYESGSSRSVHFDRPGISYIFCNIHPEMSAVVVSVPTPYYAMSTASGSLTIHDVAAGNYTMHVWAIGTSEANLIPNGRRVTVSGNSVDLGTIAVEESAPGPHKNKFGEDYDTRKASSY